MKCYNYQIGYWSHEDSINQTLTHEKLFTKEQFDDLVSDCYVKAYKNKMVLDLTFSEEENFEVDDNYSVSDLISNVIKDLIDNFGFQEISYQASFFPFGWASLKNKENWNKELEKDKGFVLINQKLNK